VELKVLIFYALQKKWNFWNVSLNTKTKFKKWNFGGNNVATLGKEGMVKLV